MRLCKQSGSTRMVRTHIPCKLSGIDLHCNNFSGALRVIYSVRLAFVNFSFQHQFIFFNLQRDQSTNRSVCHLLSGCTTLVFPMVPPESGSNALVFGLRSYQNGIEAHLDPVLPLSWIQYNFQQHCKLFRPL